jgi:hypothetical protein
LQHDDFGFVHRILSFERLHEEAFSVKQARLRVFSLDQVAFVFGFGQLYLPQGEYERRLKELLAHYNNVPASAYVKRVP